MAIVPRAASPSAGAQTSPSLAMSTVTGMVIGILGLFLLVVTYQLVPCLHRKKPPANRRTRVPIAPPPDRPSPLRKARRLLSRFTTFFTSRKPGPGPPQFEAPTHKSLRSLHLPSPQQRKRRLAREKFASRLRLNLHITPTSDLNSPRSGRDRKNFKPLDDSVYSRDSKRYGVCFTEKPQTALMSPWSPREQDFPYPSIPTPSQWVGINWNPNSPPPPFSPPPAYVPGTPMRGGFVVAQTNNPSASSCQSPPSPGVDPGPGVHAIDLSEVVVIRPTSPPSEQPSRNVFVISDDADTFSDTSSRSSTWSARTIEVIL